MKIGVGITTFNRPRHLELCLQQFRKYSTDGELHIAQDGGELIIKGKDNKGNKLSANPIKVQRKGITYRKNECLRALKDCDYIFLFDDDCFPIKKDWAEFFIEASKASGQHHFMYLKETPTIKKINSYDISSRVDISDRKEHDFPLIINEYNNCAGCMMFLTKEVIEKVGGYNPAYGIYGYEHAGYSNRIHAAGLTPLGKYTCPAGAGDYIYSMDYDFYLPFNKQVGHEPSLKNELHLIGEYLKKNKEIYDMDIQIYHLL